jgi:Fe-S-cluster-containing dehydrogenase component
MDTARDAELSRRQFLKLLTASTLAQAGCARAPAEKIVPYVRAPEYALPGEPVFYATACALSGYGMGVLVESNEGRPSKVEGNPSHPASLGATDVFAQAAVLQLWDPARSRNTLHGSQSSTWDALLSEIIARRSRWRENAGAGFALLTGNVTSDSMLARIERLRTDLPRMGWYVHDPLNGAGKRLGARLAYGRDIDTVLRPARAQVIVSFDADFLSGSPASVRYARDFSARRSPERGMSRVYAFESTPGLLGAAADERIALTPPQIERAAFRIAHAFGVGPGAPRTDEPGMRFEAAVTADLKRHAGECLLVAGESASPAVHALVHALNHHLGTAARTVEHIDPVALRPVAGEEHSIERLATRIDAHEIEALIVIGGNPAYDAPADLDFARLLAQVPWSVRLGMHVDETSRLCRWHAPSAHEFETWSDVRAFDGTASIVQPLTRPLYGGHSALALLGAFCAEAATEDYAFVRDRWSRALGANSAGAFEQAWDGILREGAIGGTARTPLDVRLADFDPGAAPMPAEGPLLLFRADAAVRAGEFANNGWLQELPRPFSKLTWNNAACLSPSMARDLGVVNGSELAISAGGQHVRAPVWILEEHADDCVTLPLGYGRSAAGPVGDGVGFDAYLLRRSASPWQCAAASIAPTGAIHQLASTQLHTRMHGRALVRAASAAEFARNPGFATDERRERVPEESLYPERAHDGYRWGMSINLNACIGCNACIVACQAENNSPVVGEEQVRLGREMHWLRVDRYYEPPTAETTARTHFQPVPCMHCEHAPCEEVCPVGATLHDSQGLNLQVYNRCVGTRFCSQNCPYKVRRFNFLDYGDAAPRPAGLENPEVTVRERGVMEKCTYCLQRITRARIESERLGRKLQDGEVVTACQAACPTQAIVFGDLNDADAEVTRAKQSPRNYALLAELNTRPRTTYLARVINRPEPDEES